MARLAAIGLAAFAAMLPASGAFGIVAGSVIPEGSGLQLPVVAIESARGDCTGVFIDNDMILTAAHCIRGPVSDIRVRFGSNRQSAVRLSPMGATMHSRHDADNHNDLAVIRVVPRPDLAHGVAVLGNAQAPAPGGQIIAVGYGWTDQKSQGNQLLRGKRLIIAGKQGDEQTFTVNQRGGGICEGDSGGPAFVESKDGILLVGLASSVSSPAGITDICRGEATFMDLRYYRDWIASAKAALR